MSPPTDLAELAERVSTEVKEAMRMPALDACRAALQEVGIRRARAAVTSAPDLIAAARDALRAAQETEREAKKRLADAVLNAEWELDGRFVVEGNKTYLVDGDERRAMTADDRAKWKAAEARKDPAVAAAETAVSAAEHDVAAARDAVDNAERRFSAAKADLQAAIAELNALGIGLASTNNHDTGGNHR